MRTGFLLLTAAAFALTACSTPLVTPDAPTVQHKMSYVRDWESLASRVAENYVNAGQRQPVFVSPGAPDMAFAVSFRKYLQKELIERGVDVRESAAGATVLSFDVQTYIYRGEHNRTLIDYLLLRNLVGALDADSYDNPDKSSQTVFVDSQFEVSLALTVMDGTRIAHRDIRRFYVSPRDLAFYWTRLGEFTPQAKVIVAPDVDLRIHSDYR